MTIELITGRAGTAHVDSADDGAYNACTMGSGCYIFSGCAANVVNANTVHIAPGEIMLEGRFVRITGAGVDATLENGAQGLNRNDLVVIRYAVGDANIETCTVRVIKGTPVSGTPTDPAHARGSIIAGDVLAEYPLLRVPVNGLTPGTPTLLLDGWESLTEAIERLDTSYPLPISKGGTGEKTVAAARNAFGLGNTTGALPLANGGTGATTAAGARNSLGLGNTTGALPVVNGGTGVTTDKAIALKSWPVGSVYSSYVSTSPASLFGGTWTAITGAFPYYNNGTGTGGSNTHTLTVAQMPSHAHSLLKRGSSGSTGAWSLDTQGDFNAEWGASDWVGNTGGGGSHNNMPAYQTLYAWRRTA